MYEFLKIAGPLVVFGIWLLTEKGRGKQWAGGVLLVVAGFLAMKGLDAREPADSWPLRAETLLQPTPLQAVQDTSAQDTPEFGLRFTCGIVERVDEGDGVMSVREKGASRANTLFLFDERGTRLSVERGDIILFDKGSLRGAVSSFPSMVECERSIFFDKVE
jgi:hypothetical protein